MRALRRVSRGVAVRVSRAGAGDLVVTRHVPVLDGSILGWLAAMDGIARVPAKRVVPGHGPVIDDWPAALQDQRRYLERLAQDVRGLVARGTAPARVRVASPVTRSGRLPKASITPVTA